jgi:spermidine synthase
MIGCLLLAAALHGAPQERYEETLYPSWRQSFEISRIIHQEKSDFWDLVIFENPIFGKVLGIDGTIQLTQGDERCYHEMVAHVPLLTHEHPTSVLIIGGGDGGLLREVLRHETVKKVVLVELDNRVMDIMKQFMPEIPGASFEDPRVEIVIQDGSKYIQETDQRFDVIFCDSTDPVGPAKVLFSSEFYGDCKAHLNKDGIFVIQNGVPFLQDDELKMTYRNRRPHFKYVGYYVFSFATYSGGFTALGWASDHKYNVSKKTLEKRLAKIKGPMKYYTPAIHKASFTLPQYMLDMIAEAKKQPVQKK